jgi:uncharacterized protein YkwD
MRQFLLLLTFFLATEALNAQPYGKAHLDNPDLRALELLTHDAVNELRVKKKIPALAWDEVLYHAAKDHADYLIRQKKLVHDQTIKDKSTPLKRVKVYRGMSYAGVGENLLSIQLGVIVNVRGRKLSTQTYSSAAMTMAHSWKLSPPHYRNIVQQKFNTTAIAISYDSTTQRLVAVQVFGIARGSVTADQSNFSDTLLKTEARELPYRLKEEVKENKKLTRAIRAFRRLSLSGGYLVGSYRTGKRAFKGRRSGVALESVPLSQFDSGAADYDQVRNRRNGLFSLNGSLGPPTYRHKMMRYSRKHSSSVVWLNLRVIQIYKKEKKFKYPVGAGPGTNLFLIHKKQLATYVTPLVLPASLLTERMPSLQFANSFPPMHGKSGSTKITTRDTVTLKVFYQSNIVEIDSTARTKIVNAIKATRGKVVHVEASAYASIDGEMLDNHSLAKRRLAGFMSVVKPYLDTISVIPQLTTKEQWELFLKQIKQNGLSQLQQMHKRELRTYVNAHKSELAPLLDSQRYAVFKLIVARDSIVPPSRRTDAVTIYHNLMRKFVLLEKKTASLVTALETAQLAAYRQMIDTRVYQDIDVFDSDRFPSFRYHALMFDYMVRHSITDEEFYERLHEIGRSKYFPARLKAQLVYNNLVFIYKLDQTGRLWAFMDTTQLYCTRFRKSEFLVRRYKRLACWRNDDEYSETYYKLKEFPIMISLGRSLNVANFPIDSLLKFYTTSMIRVLYGPIPDAQIFTHVARVKPLFHPNDNLLSVKERIRLASFYCAFNKLELARALLAPVANDPDLGEDGKKLFLTLQHDAYKDEHAYIDYLIDQFPNLGARSWCSLLTEGEYLSYLLLEDLKLKNFYNCRCRASTDVSN